ncbi:restriction endonuclease subunit S [Spirulina major]|uniref:restriction endonuclease subunit S n=1 Tax=Spirulina major TaxID=270636 RepID=UPI003182EB05
MENSSSRTAGQTGFNKATIEPYPIVFPPLNQQPEIVQRLTNILEDSQKLEENYQRKIEALGELKQSILQKAFSGQLTQ